MSCGFNQGKSLGEALIYRTGIRKFATHTAIQWVYSGSNSKDKCFGFGVIRKVF